MLALSAPCQEPSCIMVGVLGLLPVCPSQLPQLLTLLPDHLPCSNPPQPPLISSLLRLAELLGVHLALTLPLTDPTAFAFQIL